MLSRRLTPHRQEFFTSLVTKNATILCCQRRQRGEQGCIEHCERLVRVAMRSPQRFLDDFVDDALMVGVGSVSILHGKGTGALKEEIRRYLRTVPEVECAKDEHADRGGAGITIVTFKMD